MDSFVLIQKATPLQRAIGNTEYTTLAKTHGGGHDCFPTCWSPSRTVCRFLLRISSFDSYLILRSGTTAIRLKRMSWYGSLELNQTVFNVNMGVLIVYNNSGSNVYRSLPSSGQPDPLHDDPPSLVHSSSSPQGPALDRLKKRERLFVQTVIPFNSLNVMFCDSSVVALIDGC